MKSITLNWRDTNVNIDGIRIYRSNTPIDPSNLPAPIATLPPTATEYVDSSGLEVDSDYFYRVSAFKGNDEKVGIERVGSTRDNIFVNTFNFIIKFNGVGGESWRVPISDYMTGSDRDQAIMRFDPKRNHLWVGVPATLLCLNANNGEVIKVLTMPTRSYPTQEFTFEVDYWDDSLYLVFTESITDNDYIPFEIWDLEGNVLQEINTIPVGSSNLSPGAASVSYSPTHIAVGYYGGRISWSEGSILKKGTWDIVESGLAPRRSQFDREGNFYSERESSDFQKKIIDPSTGAVVSSEIVASVAGNLLDFFVDADFGITYYNTTSDIVVRLDRFGNEVFTIEEDFHEDSRGASNLAVSLDGSLYAYSTTHLMKFDKSGQKVWESPFSRDTGNDNNPVGIIVEPGHAIVSKVT